MVEQAQETVKDISTEILKKTIKQTSPLKESFTLRFSNPFFFNFLLTWVLFNWDRILVLLFDNSGIVHRISVVKNMPSSLTLWSISIPYGTSIWLPLISTLLLVLASPFIHNMLDNFHKAPLTNNHITREELNASKFDAQKKSKIAEFELLTSIDTRALAMEAERQELRARTVEAEKNIKSLNKNYNDLRSLIEQSQQTHSQLKGGIDNLLSEIEEKTISLENIKNEYSQKKSEFSSIFEKVKLLKESNLKYIEVINTNEDCLDRLTKVNSLIETSRLSDNTNSRNLYGSESSELIKHLTEMLNYKDRIIDQIEEVIGPDVSNNLLYRTTKLKEIYKG